MGLSALARDLFMADFIENKGGDATRDWRRFAIPAMGTLIVFMAGVIVSLVSIDRGGIKKEIGDLKTCVEKYAESNQKALLLLAAKDAQIDRRLDRVDDYIRVPFPIREKYFLKDRPPGARIETAPEAPPNRK